MEFYNRYTVWCKAVNDVVDTLRLMDREVDWQHIITKDHEIEEGLTVVQQYNFWQEFEGFILATEQNRVEGFFRTVDFQIDSWIRKWRLYYNHEDHEEFKEWFYKLAYTKLQKESKEADRIASLIKRTGNSLYSISSQFEQLKSLYTKLPPRTEKPFYERIKDRFLKSDTEAPYYKYSYEDWLSGNMDEVLVRYHLAEGEDIKPLIWPEKWNQFNQWLEAEYKRPKELFDEFDWLGEMKTFPRDSYTVDELTDLFVNRIAHREGNKRLLFRHQIEFYPVDERKKIWSEMAKIHIRIVADNWYHWKKWIDKAILDSVDAPKFIADTIKVIEHYFEGQTVDLIYPLYKPLFVTQQSVIDAYQSLLRGYTETEYIRPLKKLKPVEGIRTDEDIKNHKPQHTTDSPFIEAELLVKARDYLKQQLTEPKLTKAPKTPSDANLACTLTGPQINTLFARLSVGRFIDSTVMFTEFSDMLLGNTLILKPIQWLKSNRDLAYLLNTMYERNMIDSRVWKSQVEKRGLFLNEKNKPLTAQDLAQAITDYQTKGNPAGANIIDTILDEVKAHKD